MGVALDMILFMHYDPVIDNTITCTNLQRGGLYDYNMTTIMWSIA